jgi:hypothetical protein
VVSVSATVEDVEAAAGKVFRTRQAVHAFLTVPCPALGGDRPMQLVEQGRGDEVVAFLEKLAVTAPPPPSGLQGVFQGWLGRFAGKR